MRLRIVRGGRSLQFRNYSAPRHLRSYGQPCVYVPGEQWLTGCAFGHPFFGTVCAQGCSTLSRRNARTVRVAVPDWNGRISPVLDAARELVVVTVDKGREASRSVRGLEPGLIPQRARQLARLGVDVLICGGVSLPLLRMLEGIGIRVIPGISGDVNQVVHAYLSGRLTDGRFAMPGWRGRGGRRYRGGKGRWR